MKWQLQLICKVATQAILIVHHCVKNSRTLRTNISWHCLREGIYIRSLYLFAITSYCSWVFNTITQLILIHNFVENSRSCSWGNGLCDLSILTPHCMRSSSRICHDHGIDKNTRISECIIIKIHDWTHKQIEDDCVSSVTSFLFYYQL
jgi:hypothetical protein